MRRTVLFGLLCLLCLDASADARQLGELDSRSRLLCASAMLYFDPREKSPDPRTLTAVFHHLNTLQTDVQQLGRPAELDAPVRAMQSLYSELEALPPAQRQRYPELIGRLLEQQRQLAEAVKRMDAAESSEALFTAQSRALAELLLDYQLRHYPLPDRQAWLLPNERLAQLDRDIEQRFDQLQAQHAAQAADLAKIRKVYNFVRRQLQGGTGQGGGAEFYLSRAVLDLDELALLAEQGTP